MATAAWTWMVYLATHDDVAPAGEQSLARIRAGDSEHEDSPSLHVLVQQATPDRSVRRVIGATPEVVADLGQIDSGEPSTLIDFIRWAVATAPAQRYALLIWGHGSGWEPGEMASVAPHPLSGAELTQRGTEDGRHVFFTSTMRRLLAQPAPLERAVAFDDGSGHSLDTIELGQVMVEAEKILGQPVDLLGMNACLMCAVEVAYEVHSHARVYVASEDLMPVQGWPYDDLLMRLTKQPDMDAVTLGKLVVERYCAYFRALASQKPLKVTLTALQLDGIDRLAAAVQAFAGALQADIEHQVQAIWDAQRRTEHAFPFRLYDLEAFCRALSVQATSNGIMATRDAVLTALTDPSFLLATEHTNQEYDPLGGMSTYLMPPMPNKTLSPYYTETAYALATGWGKFLAAYHTAVKNLL